IQPALKMYTHYRQWLENRILLNKMRTAIVMIKKVEGTPAQVQAIADRVDRAKYQRSGSNMKEQIKGGSVLVAGPGIDYKIESPNINAPDAKDDGRNIKLAMAAATGLPEYVFGDSSNSNFASTMISEAPFVKMIQYWQQFLEYWFQELFKAVVKSAVEAGKLKEPSNEEFLRRLSRVAQLEEQEQQQNQNGSQSQRNATASSEPELSPREKELAELMPEGKVETPTEIFYGCDLQWPEVVHRDQKQLADSLTVARTNGWISDPTASSALGYDYNEEVRKQRMVEEEAARIPNPLSGGGMNDEGDMEEEIAGVLSSLTNEERQQLLQSNSSRSMVDLLLSKIGTAGGNGNGNSQDR
ncbi:MAG: hypothetical protein ACWGQW_23910, partial [bacterium]